MLRGHLKCASRVAAERDQLLLERGRRRMAVGEHHDRLDLFAELLVRHAHGGHVGDRRDA